MFDKHASQIIQINEDSKRYQFADDIQNFNRTKTLMQEKIKEISWDLLGVKVSNVILLDGQYPFLDKKERAEKIDLDLSLVCDFEQSIPDHFQKISHSDNFQIFAKKYSPYSLELIIMDERNDISNIHYGLIATNNESQRASTYFHLDSCTDEITDKEPYSLSCFDEKNDYKFATFNSNDVISSYSNGQFCKITLDPWRQALYDYSKMLQEKRKQLEMESMTGINDLESQQMFLSEMNKQWYLGNLVSYMIQENPDKQSIQEKIDQYEKQYGTIPEELLALIVDIK